MSITSESNHALFIYVPFTKLKGSFFDLDKIENDYTNENEYINELVNQIRLKYDLEITSIFLGGPDVLSISNANLAKLLGALSPFNPIEFTLEVLPKSDFSSAQLEIIKRNKVNRISINAISSNKETISKIGFKHSSMDILKTNSIFLKSGFTNINADFFYSFKNQTMAELESDLVLVKECSFEHISFYEADNELENNDALERNEREDIFFEMYERIESFLTNNGYKQYELCHFVKNKKNISLQLFIYWNLFDWDAIGLAGENFHYDDKAGFVHGENMGTLLKFETMSHPIDAATGYVYTIMSALAQRDGFKPLSKPQKLAIKHFEKFIDSLVKDGWLVKQGDLLKLPSKHYFDDDILSEMFEKAK